MLEPWRVERTCVHFPTRPRDPSSAEHTGILLRDLSRLFENAPAGRSGGRSEHSLPKEKSASIDYNPGLGRIFQSASPMVGYCVCHAESLHENHSAWIRFTHRCSHPNRFGDYFPTLELQCHKSDAHAVTIPSRDEVETLAALTVAAPL